MEAVTHLVRPTAVEHTTGRVVRLEPRALIVRTGLGELRARRAVSCLLEPELDDLVLLASMNTGESYVLAVLEREGDQPSRLRFEHDVDLRTSGQLAFSAEKGLRLSTNGALGLIGRSLEAVAREGTLLVRSLSMKSESVHAETGKLKLLAAAVDSAVERLTASFGNVYRRVEGLEQLRAGQVHVRVDGNLDLRGQNALVTAERLVKVNAEQVHMG
jgi:hypothetical protein